MKQKLSFTSFIVCFLLYILVLSSCAKTTPLPQQLTSTFTQTSSLPSTTTATPTWNYRTIILTPDDVFSLSGLIEWSTPALEDFCEHLPPPQIVANPDRFSLLSGRFVLCIYERIFTAMDLDTGSLVSTDDERGDIILGSPGGGGENPTYGVFGWNKAYIKNAYVNEAWPNHSGVDKLSYEYCENGLQNQSEQGGMYVGQYVGDIACVKTTEGKIALIRVEKIYPAITLSVEFSFAILRSD
jgi:hypothetical protein